MAEEEVAVGVASPSPSDHKRKFEDLEPEVPESAEPSRLATTDLNVEPDEAEDTISVLSDESEAKRPRVDDKSEEPDNENGHLEENDETQPTIEHIRPVSEEVVTVSIEQPTLRDEQPAENDGLTTVNEEQLTVNGEQLAVDNFEAGDTGTQNLSVENLELEQAHELLKAHELSKDETQHPIGEAEDQRDVSSADQEPVDSSQSVTHKIEVPNTKVGVLIGKAGDTIRYLQYNSGAKIQIMRDAEADSYSSSRPVQIIGSFENIKKAEKLINAVIAEADAGGSPSLVARGLALSQGASAAEEIQLQVPNEKVGLIIGRGGETIKSLQTRSGARIQLIPQALSEGEECKERTIRLTGDKMQIEIATEMIKEVMTQTVRPSPLSSGFNQHRLRGSGGPTQWGPRGPHRSQSMAYPQRGPYPSSNPQYPHPGYRNYPPQMGSRSNFGSGWGPRHQSSNQGPPSHGAYDNYGGRGRLSDGPVHPNPVHVASGPGMGTPQAQPNYNYVQQQGPDYGHHAQYSQPASQSSYGHGYNDHKYDNHTPVQNPYGVHGSSQPAYPQAGSHAGYAGQQQYDKQASYSMPLQGQAQAYGTSRPSQPGEMPYQGPSTGQSYGLNVPPQQTYPYATSGQAPQMYPTYGSAPASDGYSQAPPVASSGYPQQGGLTGYGQPVAQQAPGYPQMGATAGYVQYPPSQQGYSEQSAPNTASYGYQVPQDQGYSGGAASATTYSAAVPTGQSGYSQQAATQPGYDQSAPSTGVYGSAPASAPASTPAGYGKTVSPQPTGYAQYDSTQMYSAPR